MSVSEEKKTRFQHNVWNEDSAGFPASRLPPSDKLFFGCSLTSFRFVFFSFVHCTGVVLAQNCGRYSKQCANGECIRSSEVCDGVLNCADGSDETVVACIANDCPAYSFRCAYGACVGRTAECNGVKVSAKSIEMPS